MKYIKEKKLPVEKKIKLLRYQQKVSQKWNSLTFLVTFLVRSEKYIKQIE